jgi:serine-type D-Ala-D-Ala carboxypeptidase (penicillin-binding protein 5/6)
MSRRNSSNTKRFGQCRFVTTPCPDTLAPASIPVSATPDKTGRPLKNLSILNRSLLNLPVLALTFLSLNFFSLPFLGLPLGPSAVQAVPFDPGENPPYAAAILVEAQTGTVLFSHRPDLARSPASTQKLLLQLVVMDLIKAGKFSLDEPVITSAGASRMGGSQVYLKQGETFSLESMLEAIAIASANDACHAVAEHIGGSVDAFVKMMNQRAADLGLQTTKAVNVHGLDDTPENNRNLTTATELSQIARTLLSHPDVLTWSSTRYKPFRQGDQGDFMLYTTNSLLGKFKGLDGLKTGYTQRAGSCLVATAQRRDLRLVAVILGARSERDRNREMASILSWGFNNFTMAPLAEAGEKIGEVALDWGVAPTVEAHTSTGALLVLGALEKKSASRKISLPEEIPAPVAAGDSLGSLDIMSGDSLLVRIPLIASQDVARMGYWEKFMSFFE